MHKYFQVKWYDFDIFIKIIWALGIGYRYRWSKIDNYVPPRTHTVVPRCPVGSHLCASHTITPLVCTLWWPPPSRHSPVVPCPHHWSTFANSPHQSVLPAVWEHLSPSSAESAWPREVKEQSHMPSPSPPSIGMKLRSAKLSLGLLKASRNEVNQLNTTYTAFKPSKHQRI